MLVWREPTSWGPVIAEGLVKARVSAERAHLPREIIADALAWALTHAFTHLRLFHACRPTDPSVYYREGIRRYDRTVLDRARAMFSAQGIPEEVVEAAIGATDFRLNDGRVFLALDGEHLIQDAGHYLIYGSESVMAVGAELIRRGFPNAQRALRSVGRPALFTCDVPMSLLDFAARRELALTLYDAFRRRRGRIPRHVGCVDHTVVLRVDVPAESIREHVLPTTIPDWHERGELYRC